MQFLNDFFQRFLAEIADLDHVLLGAVDQIFYRVNAGALQTVETAHRQVKFFNGHLKDLFFDGFFAFHHDLCLLGLVREVHKKVEMFVEDLGAQRNRFFGRNRSIGLYFDGQFVKVCVIAYMLSTE